MTTNVTLRIDSDLLREARVLAARKGTSLSRMMAEQLAAMVGKAAAYEAAKRRALERLDAGFDLQWTPPASRDELHDR
jgi:predicted transcriptional regulator